MSVTNSEIYDSALALIGELNERYSCTDYESHAPYLLASFCSLNSGLDKTLRELDAADAAESFSPVYLSLDSSFPLCDAFVPLAAMYLGAMLVIDDDPDLSDSIYGKYCDAIAELSASVEARIAAASAESESDAEPDTGTDTDSDTDTEDESEEQQAICESIVERYFFD